MVPDQGATLLAISRRRLPQVYGSFLRRCGVLATGATGHRWNVSTPLADRERDR
jgi:hypothetical protein